jgi:uncharacterized protein
MRLDEIGDPRHIALKTFRKSGVGVATPVWSAALGGGLMVITSGRSGKVKRIANDPRVEVCVSDMRGRTRGDWIEAQARIVEEPEKIQLAVRALRKKYGLLFRLFSLTNRRELGYGDTVIEITARP